MNQFSDYSELAKDFDEMLNQMSGIPVHSSFVKGDRLSGLYVRDELCTRFPGHSSILVIKQQNGQEIGVLRSAYIEKAIQIFKAKPGDFVYITCSGMFHKNGYEIPTLEAFFISPEKIRQMRNNAPTLDDNIAF